MRKDNLIRLVIFGIVFMLFGCSEDLFEEKINNSDVRMQRVSMNDIKAKNNFQLIKKVNILNSDLQKNIANRFEYNSNFDFYIDEENGIYIEKDNLDSYTFPAYKNETDSLVTNIVFNEKANGEYDVIVAKYDLLKSDLDSLTNSKVEDTEVEYTNLYGRFGVSEPICVDIQEWQY